MNEKLPVRYIVIAPGQSENGYTVAYNSALGLDSHGCNLALHYARKTVARHGGEIFTQEKDGDAYQSMRKNAAKTV